MNMAPAPELVVFMSVAPAPELTYRVTQKDAYPYFVR